VQNISSISGDEVAQLYLTPPKSFQTAVRILVGFTRIHLVAGESTHIAFKLDPRGLSQVDSEGSRNILPGEYRISVGGSQPTGAATSLISKFTITGTAQLPK
jgi:beta-glucosidase